MRIKIMIAKNFRHNVYIMLGLVLSLHAYASDGTPPHPPAEGPKLLSPSDSPTTISLREALTKALENHVRLRLANNYLERSKAGNAARIGALLPKLRMGAAYTRNIPEVAASPFGNVKATSALNRHVASLLRKTGDSADTASADQLEREADLMSRRSEDTKIVLSPKDVFDGKLTLEIPVFNGPDLAKVLASGENVLLQDARVREEEANTIYATAKSYYLAMHLQDVVDIRRHAELTAKERSLKAIPKKAANVILEKDLLLAEANYRRKQAEHGAALLNYRSGLAELGLLMGQVEEFALADPEGLMFEMINNDTEKLIEMALSHRPDIKAEQQALKIAEHDRLGHFLQFLPVINLTGDAKYTSNNKGLMGRNFTYAISVNAHISLFEGGIGFALLRETNLRRQESEIKLRHLRLEIDSRIRGRKEKLAQLSLNEEAARLWAKAEGEGELVAIARHKKLLIEDEDLMEASDKKLNADIAYKKAQYDLNQERLALIYEAGLLTPQFVQ